MEEKKSIKISLGMAICISIIILLLILGIIKLTIDNNKKGQEENIAKNNTENIAKEETNNITENKVEDAKNIVKNETKNTVEKTNIDESKQESNNNVKEKTNEEEKVSFTENYVNGVFVSYTTNWVVAGESNYTSISNPVTGSYIRIYNQKEIYDENMRVYPDKWFETIWKEKFSGTNLVVSGRELAEAADGNYSTADEHKYINGLEWHIWKWNDNGWNFLSMVAGKNGTAFVIEACTISNNDTENIKTILDSIKVPEG